MHLIVLLAGFGWIMANGQVSAPPTPTVAFQWMDIRPFAPGSPRSWAVLYHPVWCRGGGLKTIPSMLILLTIIAGRSFRLALIYIRRLVEAKSGKLSASQ